MLFVHLVHCRVLDREEDPAPRILLQQRVLLLQLAHLRGDPADWRDGHGRHGPSAPGDCAPTLGCWPARRWRAEVANP